MSERVMVKGTEAIGEAAIRAVSFVFWLPNNTSE